MKLDKLKKLKKLSSKKLVDSTCENDFDVIGISRKQRKQYLCDGVKKMQSIAEDDTLSTKEKAVRMSYIKGCVYGDICKALNIEKADVVIGMIHGDLN